jgi:hypothetical protein
VPNVLVESCSILRTRHSLSVFEVKLSYHSVIKPASISADRKAVATSVLVKPEFIVYVCLVTGMVAGEASAFVDCSLQLGHGGQP